MAIEFKSIDEQIEILEKRGLFIEDKITATELLLRSNYYDVVNGYASFLQESKDKFIEGATFKDIKHTFFNRIGEAEAFFRTQVAYHFCKKHKGQYAYLDTANFRPQRELEVARLLSDLAGIINKNIKYKNSTISHYVNQYCEVPLWILVNFMEFGQLRIFYQLMLEIDKREIADSICKLMEKYYGEKMTQTPSILDSYLKNINDIRNLTAHDNRLVKTKLRRDAKPHPMITDSFNGVSTNSVFHVFLPLRFLLPKEKYENFDKSLKKKIRKLHKKTMNHKDLYVDVMMSIGFKKEWLGKE